MNKMGANWIARYMSKHAALMKAADEQHDI